MVLRDVFGVPLTPSALPIVTFHRRQIGREFCILTLVHKSQT